MELLSNPATGAIVSGFSYIVLYLLIFFLAKWINGLTSAFKLDEQLTEQDNVAVAVSVGGYFVGITIIFVGAMSGPSLGSLPMDVGATAAWSLGGIALLLVSRFINDKLILYKFSPTKEIVQDQNPGTGVVEAGSYIASALIIAGAVYGEGGGLLSALVFYLVGQLALVLFALLYAKLTPYSVHDEIEQDNLAAGLGFAGGLIAIGIIIMRAVSGDFVSWAEDFKTLAIDLAIIFVYLIGVRLVFDRLVLRNSNLLTEISKDRNVGAGLLEMLVAICFSVVLFFAL